MMARTIPEPYKLADKALSILNKKIITRFRRTRQAFQIAGFDELTVYTGMTALYKELSADCEDMFWDLAAERYRGMYLYLNNKYPEANDVDFLVEMYLAGLLKEPNEVTKYTWETESLRKRDRAIESVNAPSTKTEKETEFEKAMRYWSRQNGFYIDIIADEMAIQAMKDSGVTYVRWKTEEDHKVCPECQDNRDRIFPIDEIPPKHLHCRCWLVPVINSTASE